MSTVDVCILGDGPVGCALALALQGRGLDVALVGTGSRQALGTPRTPAQALRPIALSHGSRLILERLGAWSRLEASGATPIRDIHVSEAQAFGQTRLSAADMGLPALGHVVAYESIAPALAAGIDPGKGVLLAAEPPPSARLTVHAEGVPQGEVSIRDYQQEAIVGLVECDRPASGTAYERFTASGPLAMLPFGRGYGMVWSRPAGDAQRLLQAPERAFLDELQSAFGLRAGRFVRAGERAAFPMLLRRRHDPAHAGQISIGNAAQTLHPVAGQGLNLGLRDAWELAGRLVDGSTRESLGSEAFARGYARARAADVGSVVKVTDLLATLYVRQDPLSALLRRGAMTLLDTVPPARRFLARRMIFGASAWP